MKKEIKIQVLEQIKNVFIKAGVTDFEDLNRKQRNKIADIITKIIKCDDDEDLGGGYVFSVEYDFKIFHHDETTYNYTNKIDNIYINDNQDDLCLDLINSELAKLEKSLTQ